MSIYRNYCFFSVNMIKIMSMKNIIYMLVLLCSFHLFAQDEFPGKFGKHYISREILKNENGEILLIPQTILSSGIINTIEESDNNWIVESLYLMELPDIDEDSMPLELLNSLCQISSLEGILYYSGANKSMWPLISDAWVTDENRSKLKLDDPFYSEIPETPVEIVFYQDDIKFGGNYYTAQYYVSDNSIRLSILNISTLRYKGVPVMRSGRLNSEILITWNDNSLTFYGLSAFSLQNRLNLISEKRMQNAFDYRLSALQGWFVDQNYGNDL